MNPFFALRHEVEHAGQLLEVLTLFLSTDRFDESAFADVLEEAVTTALSPDILLLVVRETCFADTLSTLRKSATASSASARIGSRASFEIVGYTADGEAKSRALLSGVAPAVKIGLDSLRRRGVTEIFRRRGGFVESTPAFHFENPSGRHTERFMRLSNILARGAEIGFIAFATLPHVPADATIAYLDTPAAFAVIAAINEQYSSFSRGPLQADCFGSYQGYARYDFSRQRDAVVLISASSSASLARKLVEQEEFEEDRIIHLLFLGSVAPPRHLVCNLASDPQENPGGITSLPYAGRHDACNLCAAGSVAIKLNGDQFDISGPQPEALLITRDHAPPELSGRIRRLGGRGILGLVPGADGKQEHRLFDVSEKALLQSPAFKERLSYALRRSLPGAVSHVIRVGNRSGELAERVMSAAGGRVPPPLLLGEDELDRIKEDGNTSIVVVAAIIESGRSLLEISRDLRSHVKTAPILYFVGLEKTTGLAQRARLEATLAGKKGPFRNAFVASETIVLPVSDAQNAWRAELDLLRNPAVAALIPSALRGYFEKRTEMLRRGDAPAFEGLFLGNGPDRVLEVQPGFVFWPQDFCGGHADVLFTVASILQHLRAHAQQVGRAALRSSPFQQTLLAAENFGRFNDDGIQAALLRCATPRELNYRADAAASAQAGRLISRVLRGAKEARGGAAAEFLLAMACNRLSLLPPDRAAVLQVPLDEEATPIAAFLAEACRQSL